MLGSTHIFSDQYLDKEENSKVQDVLFRLLTTDEINLNPIDADDPEVSVSTFYVVKYALCLALHYTFYLYIRCNDSSKGDSVKDYDRVILSLLGGCNCIT